MSLLKPSENSFRVIPDHVILGRYSTVFPGMLSIFSQEKQSCYSPRPPNPHTTTAHPHLPTHHHPSRSLPSVAKAQSRFIPAPLCLNPWLLFSFFFFIIHVKGSLQRWVRVVCVGGGWGWGGWRGQGGGEGIHLIPGSRCIYWRLITEQQSHHALDDFIIWFLGVGRVGRDQGQKQEGDAQGLLVLVQSAEALTLKKRFEGFSRRGTCSIVCSHFSLSVWSPQTHSICLGSFTIITSPCCWTWVPYGIQTTNYPVVSAWVGQIRPLCASWCFINNCFFYLVTSLKNCLNMTKAYVLVLTWSVNTTNEMKCCFYFLFQSQ